MTMERTVTQPSKELIIRGGGSKLTPEENKAKLETIGQKAIGKINPEKHKTLLEVIDCFAEFSDYGDLDIKRNESVRTMNGVLSSMRSVVAKNNLGGMSTFTTPTDDIYKAAQFYGIYKYQPAENPYDSKWIKTNSSNSLEFHFQYNGQEAVAKVSASGKETEVYLYTEDTYDYETYPYQPQKVRYKAMVPEKVEASITLGGTTLCSVTTTLKINNASARTADITSTCEASGYVFKEVIKATPETASTDFTMTIDNEQFLAAKANINGTNMTNADQIDDIIEGNINAQELFKDGATEVYIMDDAIIKGGCTSVKDLVNALDALDDQYFGYWDSEEYQTKKAELFNQYMKAELYYTDSNDVIATFHMQAYGEVDEYDHNTYYEIEPIIQFTSDDSKYSFESYFDETSFDELINSSESLYDMYESYLKYLAGDEY